MNHSGDAAEQIVRLSLEGVEVAARITGTAAKEIAAFIVAALKNRDSNLKLKGKARMAAMLKSDKALEIFSVRNSDLQKFMQGAKQYGIVYCVLRDRKSIPNGDGMSDILVKADDAPKISRLVERFKFATVDKAKIESEIVKTKSMDNAVGTEKLLDDLLGINDSQTIAKNAPAKTIDNEKKPDHPQLSTVNSQLSTDVNPLKAKTEKSLPSAPTSESRSKSAEGTSSRRPSVRGELREMRAVRRAEKEADAPKREDRQSSPKARSTTHQQPQAGRKRKSKKSKER